MSFGVLTPPIAEIRLRAPIKIGELPCELEKVETIGGGKVAMPSDGETQEASRSRSRDLDQHGAMQESKIQQGKTGTRNFMVNDSRRGYW